MSENTSQWYNLKSKWKRVFVGCMVGMCVISLAMKRSISNIWNVK